MDARVLEIGGRRAPFEFYPSVRANFALREGDTVPASTVLAPSVDLYCLDDRNGRALFAEVADGVDPAGAPFFYLAQYRQAVRLLALPYETLHELATALPDPDLTMVYSTGRCGSTLLSRALAAVPGVRSVSEPDVLNDLVMLRHWDPAREQDYRRLVRSCVRLLGRHGRRLALKPRGGGIHIADLIQREYPRAHNVFLYRHAERWMESMHASFTGSLPGKQTATFVRYLLATTPMLAGRPQPVSLTEGYALTWLGVMDAYVGLRADGVPMLPVRYEDLVAAPRETLVEILGWCGLPADNVDAVLATFGTDSQEGTALSRSGRAGTPAPGPEDYAVTRAVLAEHPVVNTPDYRAG